MKPIKPHEKKAMTKLLNSFDSKNEVANYLNNKESHEIKRFSKLLDTPFYNTRFIVNDVEISTKKELIEDINDVLFGE